MFHQIVFFLRINHHSYTNGKMATKNKAVDGLLNVYLKFPYQINSSNFLNFKNLKKIHKKRK